MGTKQIVNATMADNAVSMVSFGHPAASLHLICTGSAAVVSIVGSNIGESSPVVLDLDSGATTISLADGVAQIVNLNITMAHLGIKKISGAGTITAVLSAPGI